MSSPSKRKTSSPVSDYPGAKHFVCNLPPISESGRDLDNDDFEQNLGMQANNSSDDENISVNENPGQEVAMSLGRQQPRQQRGRGLCGRRQHGQGLRTAQKNDESKK